MYAIVALSLMRYENRGVLALKRTPERGTHACRGNPGHRGAVFDALQEEDYADSMYTRVENTLVWLLPSVLSLTSLRFLTCSFGSKPKGV